MRECSFGDCCYLRRKETDAENDGTRGGTERVECEREKKKYVNAFVMGIVKI